MTELDFLIKLFGWQGGTIWQAQAEAKRRGLKPFQVDIMVVHPVVQHEAPYTTNVTIWGKSEQHARKVNLDG